MLAILKRRYALGEITGEQFEEMKRVLELEVGPVALANDEHRHH
ncbi:MAG TPA: SHOCT domain-containing protein [Dehalococcoidia bacterium]|nr:SHOCT domain-containing protein [Dehalococcoidia bacterium]